VLNLYLGICIFFSATFCLVTLQNTGTGTGRRRDRTALQSPWAAAVSVSMDGQEKAASRRCGIKRVGFLEHKRRRIEWAGRLLLSCFSRRCCGAGSSTTAAAVAADGESIRSLYDTAMQGPFLPAGRRPCEGRAARNGVPAASPARTIRAPEQPHPLTRGAIQWPAIGGGSGQRR